jgi:succinyl-diaminopimelate desuccinylase
VINKLKDLKFRYQKHKLLHGPTMNIGTIQGGDKVNMVADFCEFSLDTRFAVGMDVKEIIQTIKKVVSSEAKKFRLIIDDIQQPYEIDPAHPLVKTFVQTARKMKIRAPLKGSEGATVITFFQKYGIPAFATGFGSHGTAHTNDEYADVRNLVKGARLLERYLKSYDEIG